MTTATLTIRPTGRCAPREGLRPCQIRDPEWWTTGNRHNDVAIRLCKTACRYVAECPSSNPRPIGLIVAGVPHNDQSKPIKVCAKCGHPWAQRRGARRGSTCMCQNVAHHHKTIMRMRERGAPFGDIAKVIGFHEKTVRAYCQEVNARRNAERLAKAGITNKPSEHHELIIDLRAQGRTWLQVAEVIGCTPWTLRGYVKRQRKRGLIAA
ncbi:hypothetical protein ABGB07_36285 [Micromonosporaceae bacterium B7E4]